MTGKKAKEEPSLGPGTRADGSRNLMISLKSSFPNVWILREHDSVPNRVDRGKPANGERLMCLAWGLERKMGGYWGRKVHWWAAWGGP